MADKSIAQFAAVQNKSTWMHQFVTMPNQLLTTNHHPIIHYNDGSFFYEQRLMRASVWDGMLVQLKL